MPFGYLTGAPNEVIIVSGKPICAPPLRVAWRSHARPSGARIGCGLEEPKRLVGGRLFVWPFVQRVQRLSLKSMTLTVESPKAGRARVRARGRRRGG